MYVYTSDSPSNRTFSHPFFTLFFFFCKAQPTLPSFTEPQGASDVPAHPMDSHLLLDAFTLSAVGLLLIFLVAAKVAKKKKELATTKTSAT